uniref:Uncharacterized protein n=1 Tax=uncultured Nocardioidaceae bacterium TaxID=253824 RepID=A0A6J4M509_9ACTN|nr:MAG: hypothetical protein AVDCRST_MAG46-2551 [uncultured Nocardioidaceae bacterium]
MRQSALDAHAARGGRCHLGNLLPSSPGFGNELRPLLLR